WRVVTGARRVTASRPAHTPEFPRARPRMAAGQKKGRERLMSARSAGGCRSCRAGGLALFQRPLEIVGLEGLLQHGASAMPLGDAALAIAGGKDEGHALRRQRVGEIEHGAAIDM